MKVYAIVYYDKNESLEASRWTGSYWVHSVYKYKRQADQAASTINSTLLQEQATLNEYFDSFEDDDDHPDFWKTNERLRQLEDLIPMAVIEFGVIG